MNMLRWVATCELYDESIPISRDFPFKGIVSRDFGGLFLFHWIDFKVVIGPDQVYFSF
jgi:hypothetical protein